jgi:hypothetical protein
MITDELVDRALKLVAERGGNYEYFFAKLSSPDWIVPLQKRKRFSHPPPAVVEGHYLRFPRWPEGEYLTRMAPIAPHVVFAAIDPSTYDSDNEYVHQVLLEIAAEVPVDLSAKVAEAEAKWAAKQVRFYGLYEERLTRVILKLSLGGRSDSALKLLAPILELQPKPKRTRDPEVTGEGEPFRGSSDPVGPIDAWHIQTLLHSVSKSMAESAPEDFLGLLSKTLDKAVRIHDNERGSADDYSTIWRPRIQSDRFGDVLDVLVTAVRDAGVQIARENGQIVSRTFTQYKWPIFRRLEYYALAEAEHLPADVINSIVLRKELYENPNDNPEFNDFLSKVSVSLATDTREKLLAIVDAGPELSKYSKFLDSQGERREESERWIVDQWRLGWLSALTKIIGEERSRQLEALVEKYGAPRPRFSSGGLAVGHIAAIKLEEFRKFRLPDAVKYLKEWTPGPETHPEMPSRAGIGEVLQSWVSEEPALFSDNLQLFQTLDLHPTYLRSIIDAFTSQLKGERQFDPYKVAAAIEWLLSTTNKTGPEPYNWDEDPGWSWAYMSSARFLSELFLHEKRLDTARHLEFWPALKLIAENPFPSEEDEAKENVSEDDEAKENVGLLALNSTRPVGLEAVMRYARWLKMCAPNVRVDSAGLPEVFALLAAHLDAKVDNSVAVREMYGMQFTLLAWLDQRWLESQLRNLFPEKPFRALDRSAWNAYLQFSRAISAMLPAMRFRYKRAIDALQAGKIKVSDSERSLGNHLTLYYSWETIERDDELLTLFFQKASPALKSQTIGDIGWQLGQVAENLDPTIQQRLIAFWEDRLAQGTERVNESRKELAGFGWWFASKKFPEDWSIRQLVMVLDMFRTINPDFAVVERLAEVAAAHPFEAVHCLGIIFEEDREGWSIHGWSDNPQIIIREALKGDSKSRQEADRVVNLLVARGHRGFRKLLKL